MGGEKVAKASTEKITEKKQGAIATGRNDYDAAEYEVKDGGGNFLSEKVEKASTEKIPEKKQGAVATGRNDYDAAKFESTEYGKDFLTEKVASVSDTSKKDAEKKLGPREIGKSDYNPGLPA